MSRDEVVAKASEAMLGSGYYIGDNALLAMANRGLLSTPEMRECAEACAAYAKADPLTPPVFDRLHKAGHAYAASVRKPERYEADGSVVVNTAALGRPVANFYGPDAARHAREWAAKLNAEDRP